LSQQVCGATSVDPCHDERPRDLRLTGRLILDDLPSVDDEVALNGRPHVVSDVDFGGGEHVLTLEPR